MAAMSPQRESAIHRSSGRSPLGANDQNADSGRSFEEREIEFFLNVDFTSNVASPSFPKANDS
jgi:hypothetical protein